FAWPLPVALNAFFHRRLEIITNDFRTTHMPQPYEWCTHLNRGIRVIDHNGALCLKCSLDELRLPSCRMPVIAQQIPADMLIRLSKMRPKERTFSRGLQTNQNDHFHSLLYLITNISLPFIKPASYNRIVTHPGYRIL